MDRPPGAAAGAAGPQELKQQIYNQLKKAGVVSSLKSQLRTQLLEQLRKLAGPDAVRAAGAGGQGSDQTRSMWHAALNCMLAEYLQASNCQFTLSVFNSETDTVPGQPAFSTEELCQVLRLDRQPQLLQRVQELLPSQGCLVLALLVALASAGGGPAMIDSACQTSRMGQLEGLKGRLLQLEDAYMAKAAHKAAADPCLTLEQQMSAYKKECDELVELQVAARVARFREVELAAARQEAAAKYRQQLEADRAELERIHAERLGRLAAREDEVGEKLRRQQRDVEGVAYSQRQRILAEEERLRGMKAEVTRQLEVQEQLLRGLEAQLKERERAVSAREVAAESKLAEAAELEAKLAAAARKEAAAALAEEQAALRGERAALESERARLSELRSAVNADLAVARAHEDRLRTLEAVRAEAEARSAAHAAGEEVLRMQLKSLQAEAAALQQELVRAGAAAGTAAAAAGGHHAQHLYPHDSSPIGADGPLQLPQALRELGQWQRRAQQAELLLDEVTVERDAALSRADELSLDLNAARRELAALRSQLARQQQDIIQLKLQLSQAAAAVAAAAAAGSRASSLGGLLGGSSLGGRPGSPLGRSAGGAAAAAAAAALAVGQPGVFNNVHGVGVGRDGGAAAAGMPPGVAQWQQQQQEQLRPFRPLAGAAGSAAGAAEESQAASARLAQLSAADASMSQRLAEFRQRSAAQRAAAARQLEDLRAAASSSGGGAAPATGRPGMASGGGAAAAGAAAAGAAAAGAAAAGAAAAAAPGKQVQCRLSIPSEFDGFGGSEREAGGLAELDVQGSQELQQQQQRRAALELTLFPQQQQQQGLAAGVWPAMSAGGPAAAGGGIRLYPLTEALLPGGIAAAGLLQRQLVQQRPAARQPRASQQQEDAQAQQQQQQQQQQQDVALRLGWQGSEEQQQQQVQLLPGPEPQSPTGSDGEHSVARPPSSNTEFSFVQRPKQGSSGSPAETEGEDMSDRLSAGPGSSSLQQQLQQQQQQDVIEFRVPALVAGAVLAERQDAAALTAEAAGPHAAVVLQAAAASSSEQQVQQGTQLSATEGSLPSTAAPAAAAEAHVAGAANDGGDDSAAAGWISAAAAAAELDQRNEAAEVDWDEQLQESLAAQESGEVEGSQVEAGDQAEVHAEPSDAFVAELSAISSAVALEAAAVSAAAGLEGVRLSSGSMGAGGGTADRYASWMAGGYGDEEDEDEDELQQQGYVGAAGPALVQQHLQQYGQQQQGPQQQQEFGWWQEAGQEGWQGAAAQGQPASPASPGWQGALQTLPPVEAAEDASSETGAGGNVAHGGGRWLQEPVSPGSSDGSVF